MEIAQVALVSTQARRRRTFPSGWEQTGNQLTGNQLPFLTLHNSKPCPLQGSLSFYSSCCLLGPGGGS